MKRGNNYNTKQQEALLEYMKKLKGEHITANQIANYFNSKKESIGLTTIYRQLNKLVDMGKIRKYSIDGTASSCYQYVEGHECLEHFHLKCEKCGALFHLKCCSLNKIGEHVYAEHNFKINPMKTVFYGICKDCN